MYLTTGEAAEYCQVSKATLVNYTKSGFLKVAYVTPGGHRRIAVGDLVAFLERYGLPVDPKLRKRWREGTEDGLAGRDHKADG